ncbi:MAG: hypothetical protein ACFFDT_16230 [Candidatus Hodarchaeota archaeon]
MTTRREGSGSGIGPHSHPPTAGKSAPASPEGRQVYSRKPD